MHVGEKSNFSIVSIAVENLLFNELKLMPIKRKSHFKEQPFSREIAQCSYLHEMIVKAVINHIRVRGRGIIKRKLSVDLGNSELIWMNKIIAYS